MGTVGSDPNRVSAANDAGNNKDVTMKLPISDSFHTDDESVNAVLGLEKTVAMIPDAPRMSPLNNKSDAADRPIVVPPNVPMSGVKYSNVMTRYRSSSYSCCCGSYVGYPRDGRRWRRRTVVLFYFVPAKSQRVDYCSVWHSTILYRCVVE